jgi:hypothetical protein
MGDFVGGTAAMDAGKFTRNLMRINATNRERDGALEVERIRDTSRIVRGRQVASLASSGFHTGTGSALDALRESLIESEVEISQTRRRATVEAEVQRNQGNAAYSAGYNQMSASYMSGLAKIGDMAAQSFGGGK